MLDDDLCEMSYLFHRISVTRQRINSDFTHKSLFLLTNNETFSHSQFCFQLSGSLLLRANKNRDTLVKKVSSDRFGDDFNHFRKAASFVNLFLQHKR